MAITSDVKTARDERDSRIHTDSLDGPPHHLLVVVPANNEQEVIASCLEHLSQSRCLLPVQLRLRTHIVVACDACTDGTASRASDLLCPWRDLVISGHFNNVGQTRSLGAEAAWRFIQCEAPLQSAVWYAFTDADTRVPADWLQRHHQHLQDGSHGALGIVQIDSSDPAVRYNFERCYRQKLTPTDHSHVHGANLGVRADYYWKVGGFPAMTAHEDRWLVERLYAAGATVVRDHQLVVTTSGRLRGRAPQGFASHLSELCERCIE